MATIQETRADDPLPTLKGDNAREAPRKEAETPARPPDYSKQQAELPISQQSAGLRFGSIEELNHECLAPVLESIVQQRFFRYFKVNLDSPCNEWQKAEGHGDLTANPEEVPDPWVETEEDQDIEEAEDELNRQLDEGTEQALLQLPTWQGAQNPWMPNTDNAQEYAYVDLLANTERHTGYKGERATRVWRAIYSAECFQGVAEKEAPLENRLLYHLISGLHTSITVHIANDYLLDKASNKRGQNLDFFKERVGNVERAATVENLYFAYLFFLRAVLKAAPLLEVCDFHTGDDEADNETSECVQKLVKNERCKQPSWGVIDESKLWQTEDAQEKQQHLQDCFKRMITLLDCVTCNKCKLWGKLQMLGMATALKVLFSNEACHQNRAAKAADAHNASSKELRSDDDSMSSSSTPTGENGGENGNNGFHQKRSSDNHGHDTSAQKSSSTNVKNSNATSSNGNDTKESSTKGDSTNGNSSNGNHTDGDKSKGDSNNGDSTSAEPTKRGNSSVSLASDDTDGNACPPLVLERNEVIALIVMLRQFSVSIEAVRQMSAQMVGCEDNAPERVCYGCIEQLAETKFERVLEDF